MKNKSTYIIDDDKLSIKLMSMLIAKNNFCEEITSFHNPQNALDELKNNAKDPSKLPDVILLDLNMPVLDGWQFLDEFILIQFDKKNNRFYSFFFNRSFRFRNGKELSNNKRLHYKTA